jgi:hypothetical protein
MSLANLIKRGGLRGFATATPATPATHSPFKPPTVATVATVAVANEPKQAANDATGVVAEINLPDWRELDQACQAHHFSCPTCIAAGWGAIYGRRCTTGLALWNGYTWAYGLQTEGVRNG